MSNNLIVMLSNKLKESKQMSRTSKSIQNQTAGSYTITQLSNEQYFQIVALYEFLKDNEDLSNEEVKTMLKSRLKFSFLRKLDKRFPNMIEELREHGPKYVSIMYDKINQEKQADKVLKVRLP